MVSGTLGKLGLQKTSVLCARCVNVLPAVNRAFNSAMIESVVGSCICVSALIDAFDRVGEG